MKNEFNPNIATFEDGVRRVDLASKKAEFKINGRIITSQDEDAIRSINFLGVNNIPAELKAKAIGCLSLKVLHILLK